jgi:hypothetical protein
MPKPKPYVQVAAVCESALEEKDGVFSAIRIIDTITVEAEPPSLPQNIVPTVQFAIVVFLKSGDVTGQSRVSIKMRRPSGAVVEAGSWPIVLNGGEHGANIIAKTRLETGEVGLFWFDVHWNDEVLTRIPLRLARAPSEQESGRSLPGSSGALPEQRPQP